MTNSIPLQIFPVKLSLKRASSLINTLNAAKMTFFFLIIWILKLVSGSCPFARCSLTSDLQSSLKVPDLGINYTTGVFGGQRSKLHGACTLYSDINKVKMEDCLTTIGIKLVKPRCTETLIWPLDPMQLETNLQFHHWSTHLQNRWCRFDSPVVGEGH